MKYSFLTMFLVLATTTQAAETAFTCSVALYEGKNARHTYVSSAMPSQAFNLGYGIGVKLDKIDSTRLVISIFVDGQIATTPAILDSKQTLHLVIEAKGAAVYCSPQVEKN